MALFPGITATPLVAVAGMSADGTSAKEVVSFETSAVALPAGVCANLDGAGRAIAGPGVDVVGWSMLDVTKYAPATGNEMTGFMRKGRMYAVLAAGATAPAHGAPVSVNAAGEVVSAAGTAVLGAFGYSYGSAKPDTVPAGLCLIELNLPQS